ncbi:hypothetical protein TNCV_1334051 [Trichonephila clavipes]|nr:hypothetical protein TNCV_1334051 [Trichonephila clavipes]
MPTSIHRNLKWTYDLFNECRYVFVVVTNAHGLVSMTSDDESPTKFIAAKGENLRLSLAPCRRQYVFARFHPNLEAKIPGDGQGPQPPSSNHTRGLAARRLFRVPQSRKGPIYLQTSMSSPGFEPSPYDIAVSVANHSTGWETDMFLIIMNKRYRKKY